MYVGEDFPPLTAGESDVYGLDFVDDLLPGEQVLSSTWTMVVTQGVDPNPNGCMEGPPKLFTTAGNAVPTATIQRFGNILPGVTYATVATVITDQGNIITNHSHIQGVSIT